MRLHADEISRIVGKLLAEWKDKKLAELKAPEERVRVRLTEIFEKELRVEDDLNKEVEEILSKYEKEFQSGALDRRKMSQLVKNQLARERRIIL